jgi:hypothetical protein
MARDLAIALIGFIVGGAVTYLVARGALKEHKNRVIDRLELTRTRILAWHESAVYFGNFALAAVMREWVETLNRDIQKARKEL